MSDTIIKKLKMPDGTIYNLPDSIDPSIIGEEWNAETEYGEWDIVIYNNALWGSIENNNIGNIPNDDDERVEHWARIGSLCDGLETLFTVVDYLYRDGANIDLLGSRWDEEEEYSKNDIVIYDDNFYVSKVDNNIGNKPSNTNYWYDGCNVTDMVSVLNQRAQTLEDSLEMSYYNIIGLPSLWDATTTYKVFDFVFYDDKLWYSTIDGDNINHIPGDTSSTLSYWEQTTIINELKGIAQWFLLWAPTIQPKLTAGTNITIDDNNVISATGGGGNVYVGTDEPSANDYSVWINPNGVVTPIINGVNKTIPKVFFIGDFDGMSKDVAKNLTIKYYDGVNDFEDTCTLKWQGTSSLSYPKKNFTLKLTNKVDLGFTEQSKYCLKANYIDHSHARNVVSARLWGQIVASRDGYSQLPQSLRNTPNNGAVDGFPIKLYKNGVYQGLYTWNIPKDVYMFGMNKELDTNCVLCGEDYVSSCFRATAKIDETDWSDEIHDACPDTIKTRWNQVINFVMNSTDTEFVANLSDYFDVESLIDYYIFAYASCGLDSMGKNQLYITYDGDLWYASMYDMDSTWGLYWNGKSFVDATYRCQEDYETGVHNTSNLLYDRLRVLFKDEIRERYVELREGVLSVENIIYQFEKFTDEISSDLYNEDVTIYTNIPSKTTNNITQIRNYAVSRLAYVDEKLLSDVVLSSISATKTKTNYVIGDTFSTNDIVVTATYTDGTTSVVTDYTLNPTTVDLSTEGTTVITVSYTEEEVTKTTTISIVCGVAPSLSSITATKTKTRYSVGDTFSTSDITVTAMYTDGTSNTVTTYTLNPTTVDLTIEGTTEITVSYTEGDITKTTTISIVCSAETDLLYELSEPLVCGGTSATVIDTGLKLLDADEGYDEFSIAIKFDPTETKPTGITQRALFHIMDESGNPWPGICFHKSSTSKFTYDINSTNQNPITMQNTDNRLVDPCYIILNYTKGSTATRYINSSNSHASVSTMPSLPYSLLIGGYRDANGNYGRYWLGTIYKVEVRNRLLTDEEISAFINS